MSCHYNFKFKKYKIEEDKLTTKITIHRQFRSHPYTSNYPKHTNNLQPNQPKPTTPFNALERKQIPHQKKKTKSQNTLSIFNSVVYGTTIWYSHFLHFATCH